MQSTLVEYGVNTEAFDSGSHVATITVELLSVEQRSTRIDELVATWNAENGSLPDVLWTSIGADAFGPAGRPIEVRVAGDNLDELQAAAIETRNWLLATSTTTCEKASPNYSLACFPEQRDSV